MTKVMEIGNELTSGELARLEVLELRVSANMKAASELWASLDEIRDRKLYRRDYATFEDYCQTKWGFTSGYGRRLTDAASNVKAIEQHSELPDATSYIRTESQIRSLSGLDPAEKGKAFDEAVKKSAPKAPTAKKVREAVHRVKQQSSLDPMADFFTEPIVEPDNVQAVADAISNDNITRKLDRQQQIQNDADALRNAGKVKDFILKMDALFVSVMDSNCPGLADRQAPAPYAEWETEDSHLTAWSDVLAFLCRSYRKHTFGNETESNAVNTIDPEIDNDVIIADPDPEEMLARARRIAARG